MIIGKDKTKVKCYEGALKHSEYVFTNVASDLQLVMEALEKDGIDIVKYPYIQLAYHAGSCEEMARICKSELEQG